MKVSLVCVGRLGDAPEAALAADWVRRAGRTGRAVGLHPVEIAEVEARRGEAAALAARLEGAHVIACDEHGESLTSRALADRIGRLRDGGTQRLAFVVGGADGLDATVLARADARLAFGPATWPHALARAMLAEQVYRAATILAGLPYHRD